ncbi:MAG TPA: ATP12 family protein [Aestuariivirga sp.]|nr:ATP12 family protein [Aestuariivirga sp.]
MRQARRFYKTVEVTPERGIALDGKPVRTPRKALLVLPTRRLAEAVATEWKAQGDKINPASMLMTKLANTAIDRVGSEKPRILAEMVDYAASDLVCYRADRPPDLVARQTAHWDPVIGWALTVLNAPFEAWPGVVHRPQPPEALHRLGTVLETLGNYEIAALHNIMTLTGSALIALMLKRGTLFSDAAWAAAHVDEDYQIENWGEDEEAAERRAARRKEFLACCRFLELCRAV